MIIAPAVMTAEKRSEESRTKMFRFGRIGSRQLSYWSYKGEILNTTFFVPLSYPLFVDCLNLLVSKDLSFSIFWNIKQSNFLSMSRMNFLNYSFMNFDTTMYFFSHSRFSNVNTFLLEIILFFGMNTLWLSVTLFFVLWFSIWTKDYPFILHLSFFFLEWTFTILIQIIFSFLFYSFLLLWTKHSFYSFSKRNKNQFHHKIAIRFLLHKQLPE